MIEPKTILLRDEWGDVDEVSLEAQRFSGDASRPRGIRLRMDEDYAGQGGYLTPANARALAAWLVEAATEQEAWVPPPPKQPCGNPRCGSSTGICGATTFGWGTLDLHGYWEHGCPSCARDFEKRFPEYAPCWPFEEAK